MSDFVQAYRRKPDLSFLIAGIASSLLFLSIFLSFAFLLPVQIVFGRKGGRSGMAATGVSAAGISVAQAARLFAAGGFSPADGRLTWLLALAGGIAVPVVLLLALALINAPIGRRWDHAYRLLGVTALCVLIAIPAFVAFERDSSLTSFLEEEIGNFLKPLRSAVADSSEGYDASVLAASLDPKDLVATSLELLRNSMAAMLFAFLAGSWWLGNRLTGRGFPGWKRTAALDELRLPYPFLWAFLGAWGFLLAEMAFKARGLVSAVTWNCALIVTLAYAGVGLGIVSYLLKKWNTPKPLRVCLAILAVMALATPIGIAVVIILPVTGVTEIWIHYRKPKGVGA